MEEHEHQPKAIEKRFKRSKHYEKTTKQGNKQTDRQTT